MIFDAEIGNGAVPVTVRATPQAWGWEITTVVMGETDITGALVDAQLRALEKAAAALEKLNEYSEAV